jgi:cobalt-zinc-cadmium efflux system protein
MTAHCHDHAGHDHGAGGHAGHDHAGHASESRLLWACLLTGGFMFAEIAGGLISGSLALLADAGHMFVDFAGLALAFFAIRLSRRPADASKTFGYGRFQILVAYSNGLVLFGIAGLIIVEAWHRLFAPSPVLAGPMLAVAVGGLLVNIVAFFVLHGGDKEDLNMRGALLHVLGDLLGSVAAIAASLVILTTGWTPIDPILSVLVSVLILGNAYKLIRDSGHILLEGAPKGVAAPAVGEHLQASVAGVVDVHHFHVWAITPKVRAATLHVRIAENVDPTATVRAVKRALAERFDIDHATIEIESGPCADGSQDCTGPGNVAHAGHDHSGDAHHDHAQRDHAGHSHAEHGHGPVVARHAKGRPAHSHRTNLTGSFA